MKRTLGVSTGMVIIAGALTAPANAVNASAAPQDPHLKAYFKVANTGPKATVKRQLDRSGFTYERTSTGQEAIVDESLRKAGAISAAGKGFIDVSWKPDSGVSSYTIQRDGVPVARVPASDSSYHDINVKPGGRYRYTILPDADVSNIRSLVATAPLDEKLNSTANIAQVKNLDSTHGASTRTQAAAPYDPMTTVTWTTFIPQEYINAPKVGCEYGSGYKFGGDNHGFDWKSSKYRTSVSATIHWANRSVVSNTSIGTSHVYKSDGKLVAEKTASGKETYAKKMAYDAYDTVAVRMVTHAGNPFCSAGAIDGAVNMLFTTHGNWTLTSGVHRDMPNHHIYIWDNGKVTDVYRRTYGNELCLLGSMACEQVNMSPKSGKFV